ncbi:hypothetical protein N9805_05510, partial [Paracoccaceae bacterium]|nr:hypothetical protein [Paracoccaceae bacterium]
MVNQVQDRNSLFSSNIQTFLQRRGQELAGVFLLFGSILWSFILLLSTFGLSFAKLIFDEIFLSNFQIFTSSIAAPMIVTIGLG